MESVSGTETNWVFRLAGGPVNAEWRIWAVKKWLERRSVASVWRALNCRSGRCTPGFNIQSLRPRHSMGASQDMTAGPAETAGPKRGRHEHSMVRCACGCCGSLFWAPHPVWCVLRPGASDGGAPTFLTPQTCPDVLAYLVSHPRPRPATPHCFSSLWAGIRNPHPGVGRPSYLHPQANMFALCPIRRTLTVTTK